MPVVCVPATAAWENRFGLDPCLGGGFRLVPVALPVLLAADVPLRGVDGTVDLLVAAAAPGIATSSTPDQPGVADIQQHRVAARPGNARVQRRACAVPTRCRAG
jgi:hypothetical protein